MPDPSELVQPFTVRVTVYEPGALTLIEEVVAPVFHNNLPIAVVDNVDDSQLFFVVTSGTDGIASRTAQGVFLYLNELIRRWVEEKYRIRSTRAVMLKYKDIVQLNRGLFVHWQKGVIR